MCLLLCTVLTISTDVLQRAITALRRQAIEINANVSNAQIKHNQLLICEAKRISSY